MKKNENLKRNTEPVTETDELEKISKDSDSIKDFLERNKLQNKILRKMIETNLEPKIKSNKK